LDDSRYRDYDISELLDIRRDLEAQERNKTREAEKPVSDAEYRVLNYKIAAIGRGIKEIDDELGARRDAQRLDRERRERQRREAEETSRREAEETSTPSTSPATTQLWLPQKGGGFAQTDPSQVEDP